MNGRIIFAFLLIGAFFTATQALAAFPVEYSETRDITKIDRAFKLSGDNSVIVSLSRPAVPMRKFSINFAFVKPDVARLIFTANMKMNMGRFVYEPKQIRNNRYAVDMTLPKCMSGESMWYGKLDVTYISGKTEELYFFFQVK